MLDGLALRQMNRKWAQRAARAHAVPVLIQPQDVDDYLAGDKSAISIPYVGDRAPRGYEPVGAPVFVDKSGFGSEDEPAWTLARFLRHVRGVGESYWATVEEGEFQCYVRQFKRTREVTT